MTRINSDRRETVGIVAALILSGLVRIALVLPSFNELNDPDWYLPLARSLVAGKGLSLDGIPTAYRPPLYPILLAPLVGTLGKALPWGIATLHLALGLGTVALTYLTARRWNFGPNRALIAALIVGLDPVAVLQARSVMTETLAAFLVATGLAAATVSGRRGILLAGFVAGLSALCRPSLIPGAGLTALAILAAGPGDRRRRAFLCLLFTLGMAIPLIPWALRNHRIYGEPVWTTTHAGHTLALANNPAYYADVLNGPPGAVWTGKNQAEWFDQIGRATEGMSHPAADRYLRDEAIAFIKAHPRDVARASIARLGRFWGVAPSGRVYSPRLRLATAVWTVPLWIALALGAFRPELRKWPGLAAPSAIFGLTAVHAFYWTDMRMRVPIIAAIALIAAGARLRVIKEENQPIASKH